MPERDARKAERVRAEIAFKDGQTLGITAPSEVIEQIERAVASGEPSAVSFEADDGSYTVVVRLIAFVKRHLRESRVGFGAGS